jgi:hypothetical protein
MIIATGMFGCTLLNAYIFWLPPDFKVAVYDQDGKYIDSRGRELRLIRGHFVYLIHTTDQGEEFFCDRQYRVFDAQGKCLHPVACTHNDEFVYQVGDEEYIVLKRETLVAERVNLEESQHEKIAVVEET